MNAQILAETWRGLLAGCPNVLLVGADTIHQQTLKALLEASRPPLFWCDGAQFALPTDSVGTLVLRNPAALSSDAQHALLNWATDHADVQIVTVSPGPLYPLVQAGTFLDDLYYWLNVVTIPE